MGILKGAIDRNARAVAIIMAGGSGTRFWPVSRANKPKQFLSFSSEGKSLIQTTAERVYPLVGKKGVIVVAGSHLSNILAEQLPEVALLAEPMPKNTGPCLALAACKVLHEVGDVPIICLPADHLIHGVDEILKIYQQAITFAQEQNVLLTIGIKPTHPDTAYGYIQQGRAVEGNKFFYQVKRFVEKPNSEIAQQYLSSGEYFWNSGMFIWRPSVLLEAVKKYLPSLHQIIKELSECFDQQEEEALVSQLFAKIEPVSIDVGILEKADNVRMILGTGFSWSDVGSWDAWAESIKKENSDRISFDNVTVGDVLLIDSRGCLVRGDRKLIAGIGLENIVVIDTQDALLVCDREKVQDVKKIVEQLKEKNRHELL